MEVALLTVGDELLAGDTENSNASWLSRALSDRGVTVTRVLVVPDDPSVIAKYVQQWHEGFDAVIVTGGLGGTHDDVTMEAVADAFDRELVAEEAMIDAVVEHAARYRDRNPALVDRYDLDLDVEAWAATPVGSRPLRNAPGLSPGCVIRNVYVFPGVPEEMRAMFESVADEFAGDAVSAMVETGAPESAMLPLIAEARDRFGVRVGSYPDRHGPNRIKVTGTDREAVDAAATWFETRIDADDIGGR